MLRLAQKHRKLVVLAGVMLPGVLAAVVEYGVTNGVSGVWPLFAAFVGGSGTFVVLLALGEPSDPPKLSMLQRRTTETNPDQAQSSESTQSDLIDTTDMAKYADRFFTPRTATELVEEQRGQTSLIGDMLSERHKGHWMTVAGRVRDVEDEFDEIVVRLEPTDDEPRLRLGFESSVWRPRLCILRSGDKVIAVGEINWITESGVRLTKCELVRP